MRKSLGMDLSVTPEEAMERYWVMGDFLNRGKINEDKIQCIVSNEIVKNSIVFGSSQTPSIEDFADKEDTMNFLLKLS